jgi:alpha-1,2-mannosyltransferase
MLDLEVYRLGGSALAAGHDIYQIREARTGLVFTYPSFAALVFVPFALLPTFVARLAILLISLAALWLICHLTVAAVLKYNPRAPIGVLRYSAPLAIITVAAHPVVDTLQFGQINLVLTAMVLTDVLLLRGRYRGALIGIATGIKLTPGLFIVYYLVTGQRRAAVTAAATTLATVALGFAAQPRPSWTFWTSYVFDADRVGGIAYVTNQSILGMSARLLRDPHPPAPLTLGLSAIVVVIALFTANRLYRRGDEFKSVCVIAVGALLASPISWSHHWVWFIPVFGTLVIWARQTPAKRWRWLVVGIPAAIVFVGPMNFTPKAGLKELHHNLGQQILANIFGALAFAFLTWAVIQCFARVRGAVVPQTADPQPEARPDPIQEVIHLVPAQRTESVPMMSRSRLDKSELDGLPPGDPVVTT